MKLLLLEAVLERVPLCRSTLFSMEKRGRFPKRRVISPGRVAWVEEEIDEWIRQLAAGTTTRASSAGAAGIAERRVMASLPPQEAARRRRKKLRNVHAGRLAREASKQARQRAAR